MYTAIWGYGIRILVVIEASAVGGGLGLKREDMAWRLRELSNYLKPGLQPYLELG